MISFFLCINFILPIDETLECLSNSTIWKKVLNLIHVIYLLNCPSNCFFCYHYVCFPFCFVWNVACCLDLLAYLCVPPKAMHLAS